MLTGERRDEDKWKQSIDSADMDPLYRGSSARRGMTVLGKIPAVPKPINLPSQRLENRGLDPNVEIVPRGSVSWGSAGRSPPTSNSAWGNVAPASSPPGSTAWGPKVGTAPTGSSSTSGGGGLGGPGNLPRPTSGGSGTRPSSAGSIGQTQQSPDSFSSNTNSSSAWGARPSSASGVLGQAQAQSSVSLPRPRSADVSRPASNLSQFGDSSANPQPPTGAAWGGSGAPRRLGEEPHQVSRFQLTRTDFPTLGSEKNPDLRPQHSNSVADRGGSVEENLAVPDERGPPTPPGPHGEILPIHAPGSYGNQDRGAPDTWRREPASFQGPPPPVEGNWHREGPPARPSYSGQVPQADNWRRDTPPSGGPADDNWRRGGGPPGPPYGPHPGPGHYPHEGPGFMHQPRFGPGPAPYGRGAQGPGVYGHHGEMYGNPGPLLRPAGPMHPMRPNMFQGPVPYDGFYGPPGYQGMEEPERMMMGMGGGPYVGYPQQRGPPPEAFGRYPHGGMNQGPRHPPSNNGREWKEPGEGYHESPNFRREGIGAEAPAHKDGRGYGERYSSGGPAVSQGTGDSRRGVPSQSVNADRQTHRGVSGGDHGGHRDWGAAASNDEPMDFSKPVFEEDVSSASPNTSGKQSPAPAHSEVTAVEEVKREDTVKLDNKSDKGIVNVEVVKEEEKTKVVVGPETEAVEPMKSGEELVTPKIKVEDAVAVPEARVHTERKVVNVVDKEVVAKVVTKEVPTKWERGSRRAENHHREVIGPAAGSGVTPSLRPGQHSSGMTVKSGILGNAPRRPSVADASVAPAETLHPPSQDRLSGVSSPPVSETQGQGAGEKASVTRHSGESGAHSPRIDLSTGDSGVSDQSVLHTPAVHESVGKEVLKAKGKASSHDGEKEWRPKVPLAEASPRPVVAAQAQVSKAAVAVPAPSVADSSDNSAVDTENTPQPGSYDYEAQRARMKEIAAQRARQLQREEEERIKEQKAKARAKLEELDRRFAVTEPPNTEEPSFETSESADVAEEIAPVEESVPLESGLGTEGSSNISRHIGRNEHGKRERDRKANGRKGGTGEAAKGKVNGSVSQTPPVVPSSNVSAAPLLSTPVSSQESHGQQGKSEQQSRHRGRPEKKQLVARPDDADRPMPTTKPSLDITSSGDNGGWNMGTPTSQDTDLADASRLSITAGTGTLRKKNSWRSSRPRHLQEGAVGGEGIQFGDIVPGLHTNGSSGSDLAAESGAGLYPPDSGKDTVSLSNVSLSGDALTGDEGSAVSTNGDVPGKQGHRRGHGGRRAGRGNRGSQDVRAAEKSHAPDSMVWAPVRSPRAGVGNKGESVGSHCGEQQKEESSAAQQQARAKRAELERYTPKPVMKQQEALEQPAVASQWHAQAPQNPSTQTALQTPVQAGESPRAVPVPEVKQLPSTDAKLTHEGRQVESGSRPGRSHGSWRHRASGSDRGSESLKDAPSAVHSSGPVQGEAGHQRPRFEQKAGGQRRNQASSDHLLATPQSTPVAPAGGGGGAAPGEVAEREQVAHQKPYQPPRPVPAPAPRGQDDRVQGPHSSENQGTAPHSRNSGARSDRALGSENAGPHNRTSGGQHPRQQGFEREQAPSQQVYVGPKPLAVPPHKEGGQPGLRDREHQHQQPSRGVQQSGDSNEHGSHQRGRHEREQSGRGSGAGHRGQGQWQQNGPQEGHRPASARPYPVERDLTVTPQFGRMDITKQQAGESQSQPSGHQQSKAAQQTAPMPIPSPKVDSGHWAGEGGSPPVLRGRDYNHGRRGRYGGRGGPRNAEVEHRRDPPVTKQRLVIDATGGAVPSQVGG